MVNNLDNHLVLMVSMHVGMSRDCLPVSFALYVIGSVVEFFLHWITGYSDISIDLDLLFYA